MAGGLPAGIGNEQQASQATAFMRSQPWYQELVSSWGLDPNDTDQNGNLTTKLTDEQQQQLIAAARDNGIGISDSYSIDENGQIAKPDSHMLRNIAIAAGIAGLALTGFGAAGIGPLGGVLGGAGGAAEAGGLASSSVLGGTGAGGAAGVAGGAGTLASVAGGASTLGTLGKFNNLLGDVGKGIGAATTAAGQNNLNQEELGLRAAGTDITGQQAFTNEEVAVNKENAAMENQHLKDQYMLEKANHPSVSPFNITGGPKYSPEYVSTLQQIAQTNPELLKMPAPYKPIGANGLQAATGTTPSTLQKIGQVASPALTALPSVLKMFA